MESFLQDVRYGFRTLRARPGFTIVAVLTLALGIGANATIFSVVNAAILRPLPFRDSDRLTLVWESGVQDPDSLNIASAPNFLDWQRRNTVFEQMAMFDSAGRGYNLSGGSDPEQVSGVRVSANFFEVFGAKPFLGRTFRSDEETPGKDHVVVLSNGLWRRRFAANPDAVGQTMKVDGEAYTIIGVMPPSFEFQFWSGQRQLWVPISFTKGDLDRGSHSFVVAARLKRGVTVEQAASEMDTIGRGLAEEYPTDNAGKTVKVTQLADYGRSNLQPVLIALMAVVGLVLLIACVNVANLMLARSSARQREFAIRASLGASATRIARQLLTESLVLAFLGGLAGLIVASWSGQLLISILPAALRYVPFRPFESMGIDGRVLAFTWVVSCVTGILFGIGPAFKSLRHDANTALKEGSRGSTRGAGGVLRNALVAAEVGLALIVLAGAGLMILSVMRLLAVDPGLDPRNVLTMEMSLPQENLYYSPPTHKQFAHDLQEHVGSIPGVVAVSAVSHLPLTGAGAGRGFTVEGRPDPGPQDQPGAAYSVVCPHYFETMRIPLIAGREFTERDDESAPGVIIINEAMAKRYWPDEDPIGRRIKLGHFDSKNPWMTVVAVIPDIHRWGLDQKMGPEFFRPYLQAAWPFMTIVVRTSQNPLTLEDPIKSALARMEPDRPVSSVETMENVVGQSVGSRRFPMILLGVFAMLAVILAAVGIAGVVAYSVSQRTNEIGIRVALGAQSKDVLKLIIGSSLGWTLAGVAAGVGGAIAFTRLLRGLLYEVAPLDPIVLAAVCLLLLAVSLLASYLPARRATKVDPVIALRSE